MDFEINLPILPIDFSVHFKSKSGSQLTYTVDGEVPTGLVLNSVTGIMTGTPIISGFFNDIKILVTNTRQKRLLSNAFKMSVYSAKISKVIIIAKNDVFQAQDGFEIRIKSYN